MRIAVAGAGAVGRSIAQALVAATHQVLLIERSRPAYRPHLVPGADWMLADACEMNALQAAGIDTCDVVMAAAGDDKVNLVFSLLAKTEFGVPRVVARVNKAANHWLFSESWGVDIAVSTPGALVAAVGEAVTVADIVRLMTLQQGNTIVEITLPQDTALAGRELRELSLPSDAAILRVLRDTTVITPDPELQLQPGDAVMVVATAAAEPRVRAAIAGR
jgi:trk system potassium uptake protein TrkA